MDATDFPVRNRSELYWLGCYVGDSSFGRFFDPSTIAHPAKMPFRLAWRILRELQRDGHLLNHRVIDFFAGTGRTNVIASIWGLRSISIELEPHFVHACQLNKNRVERALGHAADWVVREGDARRVLPQLSVAGPFVAVTSPPYLSVQRGGGIAKRGFSYDVDYRRRIWEKDRMNELKREMMPAVPAPFGDPSIPPDLNAPRPGNLENAGSNDKWQKELVEVLEVANRSGVDRVVLVTKNPVRAGNIYRLDILTARALEAAGYELYDYHRAVLFLYAVNKQGRRPRGRLTPFKRIHLARGVQTAQWEDVLFARRSR